MILPNRGQTAVEKLHPNRPLYVLTGLLAGQYSFYQRYEYKGELNICGQIEGDYSIRILLFEPNCEDIDYKYLLSY